MIFEIGGGSKLGPTRRLHAKKGAGGPALGPMLKSPYRGPKGADPPPPRQSALGYEGRISDYVTDDCMCPEM